MRLRTAKFDATMLYTDDEALKALREAGASVLFVGSEALGQGTAIDEKAGGCDPQPL